MKNSIMKMMEGEQPMAMKEVQIALWRCSYDKELRPLA
jgi:hypothetical protein